VAFLSRADGFSTFSSGRKKKKTHKKVCVSKRPPNNVDGVAKKRQCGGDHFGRIKMDTFDQYGQKELPPFWENKYSIRILTETSLRSLSVFEQFVRTKKSDNQ